MVINRIRSWLLGGVLILLGLVSSSETSILLTCPEGWSLIGPTCNKFYSRRLTWDGALNTCKLQGAGLARVNDAPTNNEIGLFAKSLSIFDYWIGLRKNINSSSEWTDGSLWSLYQGFWSNYQPDYSDGDCVSIFDSAGYYRWSLGSCELKKSFICQFRACDSESFRCSNNLCLSSTLLCNGQEDCQDGLDEMNCSSLCKYYYQNDYGSFNSNGYPASYSANVTCEWTIETSAGSVLEINFTDIDTESGKDEIVIFVGGRSETGSLTLKRLSGSIANNYTIRSVNNFMIVRFTSDSSNQRKGFRALWSAVYAQSQDSGERFTAEKFVQFVTSFQYPFSYLPNQESAYIITSKQQRQTVHLQVIDLDLAEGDYINIYDGSDAASPLLEKLTSLTTPGGHFLSSGAQLYLLFKSRPLAHQDKRGFNISYQTDCFVTLEKDSGEIVSPGYPTSNYTNSLTCTWQIRTKSYKGITLYFDELFDIHPTDALLVFPDLDQNVSTVLQNKTQGIQLTNPKSLTESSGGMLVQFKTSAILNGRGFRALFSAHCEKPVFNNKTVVQPSQFNYTYRSVLNVTCITGHVFDSEEFYVSTASDKESKMYVLMTCTYGGHWDVQRTPKCTPRYCGLPTKISNGYIQSATGVVYGSVAYYGCLSGYKLSNNNNSVECLSNGTWSTPPSCLAFQSCPESSTPIANMASNNVSEQGNIYTFKCQAGFQLIGQPVLACKDGSWSSQLPSCKRQVCLVPYVRYATVKTNTTTVEVGSTISVECIKGYVINTSQSNMTDITCQNNLNFSSLPVCEVSQFNYCDLSPCSANETCTKKIGGYECQCRDGYSRQGNGCLDIDECQLSTSYCSQLCTNTVGSYVCSCWDGYSLFNKGSKGHVIPAGETGLRSGDVYYINHTCVLNVCPDVNVTNGYVTNPQLTYYVNDTIIISCSLGFVPANETYKSTCSGSGSWTPRPPSCSVARCNPDLLTSVPYKPAQVVPSGAVDYMMNVTITCNRSGDVKYNRTRTCMYDPSTLSYRLQGDSYDCGAPPTDCGPIAAHLSKGAMVFNFGTPSLRMECEFPYLLSNTANFIDITCSNGLWNFQDVYCIYGYCPAPAIPKNGTAIVSDYQAGNITRYNCSTPGYHPSFNESICQLNQFARILEWSVTDPVCIDSQNYCQSDLSGNLCQTVVSECSSTLCYNSTLCTDSTNSSKCLCQKDNYQFCPATGNICQADSCNRHGTCLDESGQINCKCTKGFSGKRCETPEDSGCDRLKCDLNGTRYCQPLSQTGMYAVCVCKPGYTGYSCSQLIDPCATEPCLNGGTCEKAGNSYACHCLNGYKGSNCAEQVSINCGTCGNASRCDFDYNTGLPFCTCSPGYTQGPACNFKYTADQTLAGNVLLEDNNTTYRGCHALCLAQVACVGFSYTPYVTDKGSCITYKNVTGTFVDHVNKSVSAEKVCQEGTEINFFSPWITPSGSQNGFNVTLANLSSVFEEAICHWTQPLSSECQTTSGLAPPSQVSCGFNRIECPASQGVNCSDIRVRFLCARSRVFANKSCSLRDVCSELQPCVRGTCQPAPSTSLLYTCSCPPGYEGARCQYQVKQCQQQTGSNTTNTTACQCPAGFTGDLCDSNIDECVTSDCSTAGSQSCIDGNNTYTCVCKPDYTGLKCETYVRQCVSQPCLNGGNCTDKTGGFSCSCPAGWTGPTCGDLVNKCVPNPCKSGAKCTTLLNDFYCSCPLQTYGKTCETVANVCNVSDPCLNGGQCFNNGLNCNCLTGTTSSACQLYQYNTCDNASCLNGGQCFANGTTPPFCLCPKEFTGSHCEKHINNCLKANCISTAVCVDGISEFFCRCPIGKQGPSCLEDVSDDFDLCIRPSNGVSGATLPYPVPYNGTTAGFTVKLWVKYARPGEQGNFLTLFYARDGYTAQASDTIFSLDHIGLKLANLTYVQYVNVAVNDGYWHHLLVSWRKDSGQLNLAVDYQQIPEIRSYLFGAPFSGGGFFAVVGSSQVGTGQFSGCISQLDMLSRPINTSTELKELERNSSAYTGDVYRWAEFQPYGNVLLTRPSKAVLTRCNISNPCPETPDVTPPIISFCPSDQAILTQEGKAQVSWTLPAGVNFTCSHQSGDFYPLGTHTVTCVTKDLAGNSALCSFFVYINSGFCPTLPPPRGNGTDVCKSVSNFTYCSMECPAERSSLTQPTPFNFTCGPDGSWESLRETDGLFPSCGTVKNETKVDIKITMTYHLNETNCTTITNVLTAKIREKLALLQKSSGNGFCSVDNCTDAAILVNCSQPGDTTVQISLSNISANGSNPVQDVLLVAVLDDDLFTFKDVIPPLVMDKPEFILDVNLVCPLGQVVRNALCVSCGPGTFYNASSRACQNCPVGQYAETDGQLECRPCPMGLTTLSKGSDSNLNCTNKCSSGYEFSVSQNSCVHCSRGYYRKASDLSQEKCQMCPADFITTTEASVSSGQCDVRNCTDLGKFRNAQTNLCESCPIGTYSDKKWQDTCTTCPVGLTTQSAGSSSVTLCYTSCPMGQENVNNSCQNCSLGYYKDTAGLAKCTMCPNGGLTARTASTAQADCAGTSVPVSAGSTNDVGVIVGCVVGILCGLLLLIPLVIILWRRYRPRPRPSPAVNYDSLSNGTNATNNNYNTLPTRANLKAVPEDINTSLDPAFYLSKPAAEAGIQSDSTQNYLTYRNSYHI